MSAGPRRLHVMAAAVFDAQGRVLIARRRVDQHQGGLWEFPGGKVEPGESPPAALERELWEELHIRPTVARPLIRVPFDYSDKAVYLDVWRVDAFSGTAEGREGQPLRWQSPEELVDFAFPAANRPIVNAVRLPPEYLITPEPDHGDAEFLARLETALARGIRLVQFRVRSLSGDAWRALARQALGLCRRAGARLLLNGSAVDVLAVGADGLHLSAAALAGLTQRPLPASYWVAASCHDAAELARASAMGADFAVLSPVRETASHPEAAPLGWERFAQLVYDAPLPTYALGGLGPADLHAALAARAQGIAAIRGLWPSR